MSTARACLVAIFLLTFGSVVAAEEHLEKWPKDSAMVFADKWVAAFNANDVDKHLAYYDRSKELQVIVSAGVQHNGIDAMKKAYAESYGGFEFSNSNARNMKSRVLGETAIVTFEHRFKIRDRQFGDRFQIHIRTSLVLKRKAGDWQIIHEHSSPIEGIDRFVEIDG